MTDSIKIYFAGAIRGGREDSAFYLEIVEQLRAYGSVLTEHVGDSELSVMGEAAGDRWIHDRDLAWLKEADYLVAEVTIPSLGVGYEIGKATEWAKPVLCLYRTDNARALSAMIAGSPRVTVHEYRSTKELGEVFDHFLGRARVE